MKPLRIYVDTSVFGGCFDHEFAARSLTFFELARSGKVTVLVSGLVFDELGTAPERVRALLDGFPRECLERVDVSDDVVALRDAFLDAKIVTAKSLYDATHVAAAVVAVADAIVSWNFKHIVRMDKVRQYNAVAVLHGYRPIAIVSPPEVGFDEGS
jgi:predicted nucleic acid-binding protein